MREAGTLWATPLFVVLILIEVSDLIFAVTRDPFIVYTSNVFAILGLRSLYFLSGADVVQIVVADPPVVSTCFSEG